MVLANPTPAEAPRELTARALLAGLAVGGVLALGNLTVGLATGLWDSGQVTASLLSFLLLRPLAGRLGADPLETNAAQTAACAAAAMPAVLGLLGAVPALAQLGAPPPALALLLLGLAMGVLGLLLALLLFRRMVVEEKLPFPTGVAAAELISALHGSGREAAQRGRALLAAGAAALAVVWLRDGRPVLLPGALLLPLSLGAVPAATLGLGVAVSPLLVGIGVVAGLRIAASLALGAAVGWGALGAARLSSGMPPSDLGGFLLWPGVALVLSASAVELGAQLPSLSRGLRDLAASLGGGAARSRPAALLAIAAAAAAIAGAQAALGLHPLHAAVALGLFAILGAVVGRAAGQADFAPISQAGQTAQALCGPLLRLDAARDVGVGAEVSGGVAQASTMLWSLKTGERLGASLRAQALAALCGVVWGALVALPAYLLLARSPGIGGARFPAPSASQFLVVARLVTGEAGRVLPPGAALPAAIAAVAGALLAALGRTRAARLLPLPVAAGIGFLIPANASGAVLLGALGLWALQRRKPALAEQLAPSLGGGLIAGEALLAFALAAAGAAGLLG